MLELPMGGNLKNPLINLDPRTLEMKPGLLDPTLIPDYFKDFKLKVEEIPSKGSRALPNPLPWLAPARDMLAAWLRAPVPSMVPAFAG
jgi:hypothetical protein